MTTNATNAPIWLGGVVLLLWALLAWTAWAQGAQARIVVAPDCTRAGVEAACGEFGHRHSWPVSRYICIYNELTRRGFNGAGSFGTFHEAGREYDGATVETAPPPEATPKDENPLIFQLNVSHPRNHDQISLVFRNDIVDLVTNTSTYQQEPVRLGWLRNPMSDYFTVLRDRIEIYHAMLRDEVSVLELLQNDPDLAPYAHLLMPEVVPHAPVLTINGEEVAHDHPYFDGLEAIFDEVWKKNWSCVDCATYRAVGDRILRIRTGEGRERSEITYPRSLLDCVPFGHDGSRIVCVDDEFGIFQIPTGEES